MLRLNGGIKMKKKKHPLHKIIGKCIDKNKFPNYKIIKDKDCGGPHRIPLFCSETKSNATEYCDVDLLVLKDNKIRVIIEIDESDIKPTQICGKFLTSALSSYYIHDSENNIPIGMSDLVSFIQILRSDRLKEKTSKIKQWKNLEKSIINILQNKESKIRRYKLFYGNISDFKNKNICTELITYIKGTLK